MLVTAQSIRRQAATTSSNGANPSYLTVTMAQELEANTSEVEVAVRPKRNRAKAKHADYIYFDKDNESEDEDEMPLRKLAAKKMGKAGQVPEENLQYIHYTQEQKAEEEDSEDDLVPLAKLATLTKQSKKREPDDCDSEEHLLEKEMKVEIPAPPAKKQKIQKKKSNLKSPPKYDNPELEQKVKAFSALKKSKSTGHMSWIPLWSGEALKNPNLKIVRRMLKAPLGELKKMGKLPKTKK